MKKMDKINEVLNRGVEKIYPSREALEKVLRSGKKIRLYQGFDPSMPNLHLGNLVGIMKLKQFQALGHEVIFLVGDFTGMIGDPTDKMATRKQLTHAQVMANCKNWKQQAGRILNFTGKNPAKFLFNSQWLAKLSFSDLVKLASNLTYQQTIKREMFKNRLKDNKDIYLHEFFYPLMQGYDSVYMDVDLEIGGSDQMFNMLVVRDLMHKLKRKEKFVLCTKLLVDFKGEKVGKTTGNALFLNASPEEMFGGIMSFPDEVISLAFELLTFVPMIEIQRALKNLENPMVFKKQLAFEIVKLQLGATKAQKAQEEFEHVFQKKQLPIDHILIYDIKEKTISLVDLLTKSRLALSRSEAKRLIEQGGVDIDGKEIRDKQYEIKITDGMIIRVGKRKFIKIRTTN